MHREIKAPYAQYPHPLTTTNHYLLLTRGIYPILCIARGIGNVMSHPGIRDPRLTTRRTYPTLDSHTVRLASQTKYPYHIRARFQLALWH